MKRNAERRSRRRSLDRRGSGLAPLLTAALAGMAGGLVAPLIFPSLAGRARPAAKGAIKAGLALFERARVATAELGESATDLFAEAKAEFEGERLQFGIGAGTAGAMAGAAESHPDTRAAAEIRPLREMIKPREMPREEEAAKERMVGPYG
jgi:hypothetical protein